MLNLKRRSIPGVTLLVLCSCSVMSRWGVWTCYAGDMWTEASPATSTRCWTAWPPRSTSSGSWALSHRQGNVLERPQTLKKTQQPKNKNNKCRNAYVTYCLMEITSSYDTQLSYSEHILGQMINNRDQIYPEESLAFVKIANPRWSFVHYWVPWFHRVLVAKQTS